MKFLRWLNIVVLLTFLLSACSPGGGGPISIPGIPTETSLPQPLVTVNPAPNVDAAMTAYLDAFKADDYNTMYSMLSKVSQDTITLEDFARKNRDALNTMSAGSFDYEMLSSLVNPYSSEVSYRVTYHTALVGDIQTRYRGALCTREQRMETEMGGWADPAGIDRWQRTEHGLQRPLARQHL